jgi:uncharacterized RmlC-like cupin family protein
MQTATTSRAFVLRPTAAQHSKQGLLNADAISAETVGSQALWMGIVTIPPGAKANAHFHERHETAIYVVSGGGELWFGDRLQDRTVFQAGDFIYIDAGVPHVPINTSPNEPIVTIIARTDPNEQESVVLIPDLDGSVDLPEHGDEAPASAS